MTDNPTSTVRTILLLVIGASLATSACEMSTDANSSLDGRQAEHGDITLTRETTVVAACVRAGATLLSVLRAHDVAASEAAAIVAQAAPIFDLRKVRANQPYRLESTLAGTVRDFEYEIDGDRVLRVGRSADDTLVASVLPIPKTRSIEVVVGGIDRDRPSLSASLDAGGETIDLALAMADIFGGEIDFSTELQRGDRFELTVEKQFRDAHVFAGYGPILAAEFDNAGRHVKAVRFTPEGGSPAYFDEHGVSMKRFFLASPLKFQPVVTSGFSRARLHPILREVRAHLGVDYRAAAGAPVVAVADGTVISAGAGGASGRMVHLRHASGYESEYLHLSSMAVHAGDHVRQGELIGRVGSSGLSTAAHLDYRLKKNGAFINPVTAHRSMPPADPVPPSQMAAFALVRDRAFERLATASPARLAHDN